MQPGLAFFNLLIALGRQFHYYSIAAAIDEGCLENGTVREIQGIVDDVQDLRVLVADDQINMRRTVKNMLRMMGFHQFRDADDGDVALRILESEPIDLVICDWNMPRVKGVSVLRTIRGKKKYDDTAFLMLTGEVEEGRVAETIEADVDAYIIKPFEIHVLEEKLIAILGKRRAPSALDIHFNNAESSREAGEFAQAHRDLDKAAQIRPQSPMLFYQRGLVFEAEGHQAEAEKCFHLAKQRGPLFIRVHDKLAHIYQARGRTTEVCNILGEAIKISPNNINRQMRLGRALLAEKRYSEARMAFLKVIQLDRENQTRKMAIAKLYLSHNMVEDAIRVLKQCIQVHPEFLEAYNRLGMLLRRSGQLEEALEYYLQALKVAPYDPNLFFNLARVLADMGRIDAAIANLQKAVEAAPDFQEARVLLKKLRCQPA